jgi:rubrerythrin
MSNCKIHINNKHQEFLAQEKVNLDEIFGEIEKMKERAGSTEGFRKTLQQYLKQINEEKLANDAHEILNQVKINQLHERSMKMRSEGVPLGEAYRSLLTQSTYNVKNAGASMEAMIKRKNTKYMNMIHQGFSDAEHRIMGTGELDDQVVYLLGGGKFDASKHNPLAKKMADTYQKIYDGTLKDRQDVGIFSNKIDNYAFSQSVLYNDGALLESMGKDVWVNTQMKDLDHAKSFPYLQTTQEKMDHLGKVYDKAVEKHKQGIETNWKSFKDDSDIVSAIQNKYGKERTLHYTPEGLVNQFKTFAGDRKMVSMVMAELSKSNRDVVTWDVMGPRGTVAVDNAIQKTKRELNKMISAAKDPKVKEKLRAEMDDLTSTQTKGMARDWAQIANENNKIYSQNHLRTKVAWDTFRKAIPPLILGKVAASAVTDMVYTTAAQQITFNKGYFESLGSSAKSFLDNLSPKYRNQVARAMKIEANSFLIHHLQAHEATNMLSKGVAKVNYFFSKAMPVNLQTMIHQATNGGILGSKWADLSHKGWDSLGELNQKAFEKAGVLEHDWKAFQELRDKSPDGVEFIGTDKMHQISDETALAAIAAHKNTDPHFTYSTPDQYRAYLEKRLDAFVHDFVTTGVPMPGDRVTGLLHGIGQDGDWKHEAWKTAMMLKAYSVNQYRVMAKVARASTNKVDKVKHLSGLAAGLLAYGYLREHASNYLDGKDTDLEDNYTKMRVLARSGVGGILGDLTLNPQGQGKYSGLINLAAGPAFAKANDLLGIGLEAAGGDFSPSDPKDLKKVSKFIPGNNLLYLELLNKGLMEDLHAATN